MFTVLLSIGNKESIDSGARYRIGYVDNNEANTKNKDVFNGRSKQDENERQQLRSF
jgi:hypothetical protein